ncbi:MAG: hypothetical protein AB8B70_10410 [Prochlorococcus sp.]
MIAVAPAVEASQWLAIRGVVSSCLQTRNKASCTRALLVAESLQQKAAESNNYRCQSQLLGVQADVIMVQLKAGRGEKALASLADADQNCKGL